MKTGNQLDSRSNVQLPASLDTPLSERGNGNFLRTLATQLMLGTGVIGAGFGMGEAKASATEPGQSVQRGIKQGKEVTPLKSSSEWAGCGQISTPIFEKGTCYVTDVADDKKVLRVTIAVGLNLNAGVLVIGGSVKGMFTTTCDFAPGTDRGDAYRATQKVLYKQLSNEMKPVLAKALGAFTGTGDITKMDDRSQDKAWKELLRKNMQKDRPL